MDLLTCQLSAIKPRLGELAHLLCQPCSVFSISRLEKVVLRWFSLRDKGNWQSKVSAEVHRKLHIASLIFLQWQISRMSVGCLAGWFILGEERFVKAQAWRPASLNGRQAGAYQNIQGQRSCSWTGRPHQNYMWYVYIYNDTCACHSSSKSCCNSWHTMSHWKEKSLDQWAFHVLANWMATLDGGPELIPILGAKRNPTIEISSPGNVPSTQPASDPWDSHASDTEWAQEIWKKEVTMLIHKDIVRLTWNWARLPMVTVFESFPTTLLQISCMFAGRGKQICCCSWIKPLLKQSSHGTRHNKSRSITATRLPQATKQGPCGPWSHHVFYHVTPESASNPQKAVASWCVFRHVPGSLPPWLSPDMFSVPAKACSLSHQRPEGSEMLTVHLHRSSSNETKLGKSSDVIDFAKSTWSSSSALCSEQEAADRLTP